MKINLLGVLLCVSEALPYFSRRGNGVIVNIASVGGLFPMSSTPIYGATKAAVVQATKNLKRLCAQHQCKIHALCPGYVDTPLAREGMADPVVKKAIDLQGGLMKIETVAKSLERLLSEEESGSIVVVLPSNNYAKFPRGFPERQYFQMIAKL